jgi:uncharacterized protein (TIGR02147 family)
MPNIFEYTDYRRFVRDYYKKKKSDDRKFSYQVFAVKAGFRSKSSVANIACCNYALTKNKVHDLAKAMALNVKETEYFESMVGFCDAKTTSEREFHFNRMRRLFAKSDIARLKENQFEYYSKWYNCAIRELITKKEYHGDHKKLAKALNPPITAIQAKKAVKLLLDLGMIEKNRSGGYRQKDKVFTTGDEVRSLGLRKFHMKNLDLAAGAIERQPLALRDVSSVTMGISSKGYARVKREISLFRKNVLKIVAGDDPVECVYQMGVQLFPISKPPRGWENGNEKK